MSTTTLEEPAVATASWREDHWHAAILLAALGVLATAAILQLNEEGRGVLPWLELPLPEMCFWQRYFGARCPGCGLTRSFIALMHGDWSTAWQFNPVGWLIFTAVVFQVPYRAMQWWRTFRGGQAWRAPVLAWAGWALLPILLVQWIVRSWG